MVTNVFSWGTCNSYSRYNHKAHMKGVGFYPFPKPSVDLDRRKAWINP